MISWATSGPSLPCPLCTAFHPVREGSATTNWRCITGSTAHPLAIVSLLSHENGANHNCLKATTIAQRDLFKLSLRPQRHLYTSNIYTRFNKTAWNDDTMRPGRQVEWSWWVCAFSTLASIWESTTRLWSCIFWEGSSLLPVHLWDAGVSVAETGGIGPLWI